MRAGNAIPNNWNFYSQPSCERVKADDAILISIVPRLHPDRKCRLSWTLCQFCKSPATHAFTFVSNKIKTSLTLWNKILVSDNNFTQAVSWYSSLTMDTYKSSTEKMWPGWSIPCDRLIIYGASDLTFFPGWFQHAFNHAVGNWQFSRSRKCRMSIML